MLKPYEDSIFFSFTFLPSFFIVPSSLWTSFVHPPSLSIDLFRFVCYYYYCYIICVCVCWLYRCSYTSTYVRTCLSVCKCECCLFTNKLTNIMQRDKVKAKYERNGKKKKKKESRMGWRIQELSIESIPPHECLVPGYRVPCSIYRYMLWVHFLCKTKSQLASR